MSQHSRQRAKLDQLALVKMKNQSRNVSSGWFPPYRSSPLITTNRKMTLAWVLLALCLLGS